MFLKDMVNHIKMQIGNKNYYYCWDTFTRYPYRMSNNIAEVDFNFIKLYFVC